MSTCTSFIFKKEEKGKHWQDESGAPLCNLAKQRILNITHKEYKKKHRENANFRKWIEHPAWISMQRVQAFLLISFRMGMHNCIFNKYLLACICKLISCCLLHLGKWQLIVTPPSILHAHMSVMPRIMHVTCWCRHAGADSTPYYPSAKFAH